MTIESYDIYNIVLKNLNGDVVDFTRNSFCSQSPFGIASSELFQVKIFHVSR